ncbi:MAG TPA: hydrogenase maturation protease [Rhodocyclaceae bacterium]|mgnify:FL=1|nr:hydrogenase maturation protease [Rhodocyclaceae bacterium]
MTATTLIFGWGNPSRGDDALGPLFIEQLEALALQHPEWGALEFLCDFQLQVEHALDLRGRQRVLFVDAGLPAGAPFSVENIGPARDASFTSHAMTPQAVLHAWTLLERQAPPATLLLRIRGEQFGLGLEMSAAAQENLAAALAWAENWLNGDDMRQPDQKTTASVPP